MAIPEGAAQRKSKEDRFLHFGARVYYQVVNAQFGKIGATALSRRFPTEAPTASPRKGYQGRFIEEKSRRGNTMRPVLSAEPLSHPVRRKRESSYWTEYRHGRTLPSFVSKDPGRPTVIELVEKEKPGTMPWVMTPLWWLFEKEMRSKAGVISLVQRLPIPCQEKLLLLPSESVQPYLFQSLIEEDIFEFALLEGPWGLGGLACIAGILDIKDEYLKLTAFTAIGYVLRRMKRSIAFKECFDKLFERFCYEAQKQWYLHPCRGPEKIDVSDDAILGFALRLKKYAKQQKERRKTWKVVKELIHVAEARSQRYTAAKRDLRGIWVTDLAYDDILAGKFFNPP
jgi:hypothetical protein